MKYTFIHTTNQYEKYVLHITANSYRFTGLIPLLPRYMNLFWSWMNTDVYVTRSIVNRIIFHPLATPVGVRILYIPAAYSGIPQHDMVLKLPGMPMFEVNEVPIYSLGRLLCFFYLQWDNLAIGKYLLFIKFELMVLVIFYAYNSNISLNIYATYLTQMSAADKINTYS